MSRWSKLLVIATFAALAVSLSALPATANPILGGISFAGSATPDTGSLATATAVNFSNPAIVMQTTGDYSIFGFGTWATFNNLTISPVTVPIQLWSITTLASFTLQNFAVTTQNASSLILNGTGVLSLTGYTDTAGSWTLTANQNGTGSNAVFSFSAGNAAAVPEPASLLLFGLGAVGLAGVARRQRRLVVAD